MGPKTLLRISVLLGVLLIQFIGNITHRDKMLANIVCSFYKLPSIDKKLSLYLLFNTGSLCILLLGSRD